MKWLGNKISIQLHMVSMGTSSYRSKIALTFYLNLSSHITTKILTTFKLLILIFFFCALLIPTLPTKNASWILEVGAKWDAIVAMLLDWFCSIFALVINHSPSPINYLEYIDALGIKLEPFEFNEIRTRSCFPIDRYAIHHILMFFSKCLLKHHHH